MCKSMYDKSAYLQCKPKQGIAHKKINRKVTLQLDVMFMKTKSFANFQLKILKHVGGKCGKLFISNILCSKMDITCKKLNRKQ